MALIAGEGDARKRVTLACQILSAMYPNELNDELSLRLKKVLDEAGKNGPLKNADGAVLEDRFEHTSKTRRNSTYAKLAKEIHSIYEDSSIVCATRRP